VRDPNSYAGSDTYANANAYANSDPNPNTNSDSDTNTNTNAGTNTNADTISDTISDSNGYPSSDTGCANKSCGNCTLIQPDQTHVDGQCK
jgi:hypothetical protein